jgi:hypothetical protein
MKSSSCSSPRPAQYTVHVVAKQSSFHHQLRYTSAALGATDSQEHVNSSAYGAGLLGTNLTAPGMVNREVKNPFLESLARGWGQPQRHTNREGHGDTVKSYQNKLSMKVLKALKRNISHAPPKRVLHCKVTFM